MWGLQHCRHMLPCVALALLTLCALTDAQADIYKNVQYHLNTDHIPIPQGAASLAFVFDITGSMYDDLVQVIEGAAKILATTLARREKPLYNYVLVPFHDPGKRLVLVFVLWYCYCPLCYQSSTGVNYRQVILTFY